MALTQQKSWQITQVKNLVRFCFLVVLCVLLDSSFFSSRLIGQEMNDPSRSNVDAQTQADSDPDKKLKNEKEPLDVAQDLGDQIKKHLLAIFQDLAADSKSQDNMSKITSKARTTQDYMLIQATGNDKTFTATSAAEVGKSLAGETKRHSVARVMKDLKFWQRLNKGLDFRLDFGSWFGANTSSPKTIAKSDNLRYGLILKKIKSRNDPSKYRAAVSSAEEELRYANKDDVEWTIGPIVPEHEAQPTKVNVEFFSGEQSLLTDENSPPFVKPIATPLPSSPANQEKTYSWDSGNLPSSVFKGNIAPINGGDEKNLGLAGIKLKITQEQQFYEFTHDKPLGTGESTVTHNLRLPVVGAFAVGRVYNKKFETITTSCYNILVAKEAPSVSLHYLHEMEQYQAESAFRNTGFEFGIAARSKAKKEGATGADAAETYQVNVKKSF